MIYRRRNLTSPHNFSLQGALLSKKLSNDASSESQIENLRDFYRGFVLVGSAAPSLFTLTRLSRPRQLVIRRPERTAHSLNSLSNVLSLNSLWYERLFSRDDMAKLIIHRRYAGKRLSTQPQAKIHTKTHRLLNRLLYILKLIINYRNSKLAIA